MTEQWAHLSLGELTETTRPICYGVLKPGPYVAGGVPLIRIQDMEGDRLEADGHHLISDDLDEEFKRSRLSGGEVLLSIQGTVGRVALCPPELAGANISRTVAVIEPDARLTPQFLRLYLQLVADSEGFDDTGSTRASLNISTIRAMQVPVPPLPVQRRIVDLLTHLDAHIANLRAEATSAFKARMAYLSTAVRAPAANGTNERTLRSLATWRGGLTPSKSEPTYWFPGDVPWVSSKEVVGTVLRGTEKLVSKRALEETSLRLVSPGSTVVVVRSGILVHTLPIAYVPFACTVNQDVKAGTPHQDVDNRFLTLLLEATASELLPTYRKTGTTVQSLNFEALLEHSFNVPPLQVQEEIADVVFEFDSAIRLMESEVKLLQDLRKSLLASLLSRKSTIDPKYDSLTRATV